MNILEFFNISIRIVKIFLICLPMLKSIKNDRFIPARTPDRDKKIRKLQLDKSPQITSPKRIHRFTFTKRHSNTNTIFHMNISHSSFDKTSHLHKRIPNPKEHIYTSLLKSQLLSPLKRKYASNNRHSSPSFSLTPLSSKQSKCIKQYSTCISHDKANSIHDFDTEIKHELNLGIGYKKKMISFSNDIQYNTNTISNNNNTSLSNPNYKLDIINYLARINKQTKPSLIKVLDAPGLIDDFYLHLLSWSTNDIISVCLKNELYLLNNKQSSVHLLTTFPNRTICSCSFLDDPNLLSIGLNTGEIFLYDIVSQKQVSHHSSHTDRIGVITPIPNAPSMFSSGSRDTHIHSYDTRSGLKPVLSFTGSTQEICSLKWSGDAHILASGSNDNKLLFFKMNNAYPYQIFNDAHSSAIRALDWSRAKVNFLGTGGGVQDQMIKIWNCNTMELVQVVNAESQVCNLRFSKRNQMVTTHGFTDNLVNVWKLRGNEYEDVTLVDSLSGHRRRVLYMAVGPNERMIATGSGDETVRIWEVFEKGSEGRGVSEVEVKDNLVR